MPGANHRNQAPQLVPGGDIYPSRFVMLSTAADNTVLGCTAGSPPIGISQVGTKYPITNPTGQLGGGTITGPGIAAEGTAGIDQIQIFSLGDVCWLECGGTVAAGDLLEAAGTTTNVGRGVKSGPGRNFGAIALEAGTVGLLIRVQIILPSGGGAGVNAAETVITTRAVTSADSGKTLYLALAGGFTTSLPAATAAVGAIIRFRVLIAPTTSYIITAPTAIMYGMMEERAGGAGVAGAGVTNFNFVANQAKIADWVDFESDGTKWIYHGMVDVAAGNTVS